MATTTEHAPAHGTQISDKGRRLRQIWAEDTQRPEYWQEMDRQVALLNTADAQADDMDFVEAITGPWDEDR